MSPRPRPALRLATVLARRAVRFGPAAHCCSTAPHEGGGTRGARGGEGGLDLARWRPRGGWGGLAEAEQGVEARGAERHDPRAGSLLRASAGGLARAGWRVRAGWWAGGASCACGRSAGAGRACGRIAGAGRAGAGPEALLVEGSHLILLRGGGGLRARACASVTPVQMRSGNAGDQAWLVGWTRPGNRTGQDPATER